MSSNIHKQLGLLGTANRNLKLFIAREIAGDIKENAENVLVLLQTVFKMAISGQDDRSCAFIIFRALKNEFIRTDLCNLESIKEKSGKNQDVAESKMITSETATNGCEKTTSVFLKINNNIFKSAEEIFEYLKERTTTLGSTGKDFSPQNTDLTANQREVQKQIGIDRKVLRIDLVDKEDIVKPLSRREELALRRRNQKKTVKKKQISIASIPDFFNAILECTLDTEYQKRIGGLGILCELLKEKSVEKSPNTVSFTELKCKYFESPHNQASIESKNANELHDPIIYSLDPLILLKILQVLYSDKLTDFVSDQISLPVRDKSADLFVTLYLKIFPPSEILFNDSMLLDLLFLFVRCADWQIQCSGLLCIQKMVNYGCDNNQEFLDSQSAKSNSDCQESIDVSSPQINTKVMNECRSKAIFSDKTSVMLKKLLMDVIAGSDEDSKFLAADILLKLRIFKQDILDICWKSISDSNEIAISKKNVLKLISEIYDYQKLNKKPTQLKNEVESNTEDQIATTTNVQHKIHISDALLNSNLTKILALYVSPLIDIRQTAHKITVNIYQYLDNQHQDLARRYMLESLLVEEDFETQILASECFTQLLLRSDLSHVFSLIAFYMNILCLPNVVEYNINDFFLKSDFLIFSDSGCKLLGENNVLRGKLLVIDALFSRINHEKGKKFGDRNIEIYQGKTDNNSVLIDTKGLAAAINTRKPSEIYMKSLMYIINYNTLLESSFLTLCDFLKKISFSNIFTNLKESEFQMKLADIYYHHVDEEYNRAFRYYFRIQALFEIMLCMKEKILACQKSEHTKENTEAVLHKNQNNKTQIIETKNIEKSRCLIPPNNNEFNHFLSLDPLQCDFEAVIRLFKTEKSPEMVAIVSKTLKSCRIVTFDFVKSVFSIVADTTFEEIKVLHVLDEDVKIKSKIAQDIMNDIDPNITKDEHTNHAYLFFREIQVENHQDLVNYIRNSKKNLLFYSKVDSDNDNIFYNAIAYFYGVFAFESEHNEPKEIDSTHFIRPIQKIMSSKRNSFHQLNLEEILVNYSASTTIIRRFVEKNIQYQEIVIKQLLKNFNLFLLDVLVDIVDPAYNFLFAKQLIPFMHSNDVINFPHYATLTENEYSQIQSYTQKNTPNNHISDLNVLQKKESRICFDSIVDVKEQNMASKIFSHIVPRLNISRINMNISSELQRAICEAHVSFVEKLQNNNIENFSLTAPLKISLRDYQLKGVAWLSFLNESGVNGILADDMGLGKTIMVLSFLANEFHKKNLENLGKGSRNASRDEFCSTDVKDIPTSLNNEPSLSPDIFQIHQNEYKTPENGISSTEIPNKSRYNLECRQSHFHNQTFGGFNASNLVQSEYPKALILTPSSLTGHWEDEIRSKFDFKCTVHLNQGKLADSLIVITSFDFFKRNSSIFNRTWPFLIIDEGHLIRNRETNTYKQISLIKAKNKIVLTGTPINNSIQDLYSLFNILMPGYLGSEKEFNGLERIISKAKDAKASSKDIKESNKVLKDLHKKTLPFILRRLKTQVLKDLPPKIVVDVNLQLNSIQRYAYDMFDSYENSGFGKITELLKICSHAKYISKDIAEMFKKNGEQHINKKIMDRQDINNAQTPDFSLNSNTILNEASNLGYNHHFDNKCAADLKKRKIESFGENSCKISALFDIIKILGGSEMSKKLLIFCQFKQTVAYLLEDIKSAYPSLKIDKIDGSTKDKHKVASDFNTSTETNILILTTNAGGVGLNLTSASYVVMFEHDFNPFNDLQAMDRCHRIGQKNTVNIYRLICKDTIEERKMNLQQFKLHIAESLVTQQNTDIKSMEANDLLERFIKEI